VDHSSVFQDVESIAEPDRSPSFIHLKARVRILAVCAATSAENAAAVWIFTGKESVGV
jgi:hypothetical protein